MTSADNRYPHYLDVEGVCVGCNQTEPEEGSECPTYRAISGRPADYVEHLESLIHRISSCYEGRFDRAGAHVFMPAEVWNAIKDADEALAANGRRSES